MTTKTPIICALVVVVALRAAAAVAQPASDADEQEMVIPRTVPPPLPPPPPSGGPVSPAPRALTMEDVSNPSMEELQIRGVRSRYSLNFFGDTSLTYGRPATGQPATPLGFSLGAQDLLLKGELGNHIVATTEFAMEPSDAGVVLDIERFNVRWQADGFYIEAGRSHTAFGYWNNAYHHGRWLQPTITRPRWVAFEDDGGILPVHWVGVDLGAKVKLAAGTLNAYLSIGNGRGKIVDDVRNARDYQSLKALHVGVDYVGIHWPELRAGISGVIDRIPAQPAVDPDPNSPNGGRPALPDRAIDEIIGGAYVAYASFPLVFITEGYLVNHQADSQTWRTYGGFALVGYAFGRFTPYAEFERVASSGGQDPFFVPDPTASDIPSFNTAKGIGGIRIDLSDWTALKIEYRYTRFLDSSTSFQEGVLNWSWGF